MSISSSCMECVDPNELCDVDSVDLSDLEESRRCFSCWLLSSEGRPLGPRLSLSSTLVVISWGNDEVPTLSAILIDVALLPEV